MFLIEIQKKVYKTTKNEHVAMTLLLVAQQYGFLRQHKEALERFEEALGDPLLKKYIYFSILVDF